MFGWKQWIGGYSKLFFYEDFQHCRIRWHFQLFCNESYIQAITTISERPGLKGNQLLSRLVGNLEADHYSCNISSVRATSLEPYKNGLCMY